MNVFRFLLLGILISFNSIAIQALDVNILDFGANVDKANNAPFIQKAIDDCAAAGGGYVTVPAGTFVTGTLFLKNNVHLQLHVNAVIQGSVNPEDYQSRGFIVAENIENASITGEGTIDGQGNHKNFQFGDNSGPRAHLLHFINCRNMAVKGVRLFNSAMWTFRMARCDGILVQGVYIYAHGNHNNDGLDIDSKNVIVSDCRIDCDDDALCFKSDYPDFDVEHVVVTNCILSSNCNAIKFGTASHAGFRNITISNCAIHKASENNIRTWKRIIRGVATDTTVISGIALEVVDGGFMDQIVINNITMRDIQTPLFIRLGSRKSAGALRNVVISGITACNSSLITSSITGIPGHQVENVTLRDLIFYYTGGGTAEDATRAVPENEKSYPENRMFGPSLPAYGLYVRHARNLTIENFQCYTLQPDARPAFVFDDVQNVSLNNFQASRPSGDQPLIHLNQSSDFVISGFRTPQTTIPLFLQTTGELCKNISVVRNDLTKVTKTIDCESSTNNNISIKDNIMSAMSYFGAFPDGYKPEQIGEKLSKRFLPGKHMLHGGKWIHYAEVCTWYGALRFARVTGNSALIKQLQDRFEPLFSTEKAYQPVMNHVDLNMFGCLPLEFYQITKDKRFYDLGMPYADTQWKLPADATAEHKALAAKNLSWQTRMWIDDMFMITIVQSQAYKATGDLEYINRAAKEMVIYLDSLQQHNGLFFHAPDVPFFWSRGNGWMASGMTELLRILPENNPDRPRIMQGYLKMMQNLKSYRSDKGLWNQLIDAPEFWTETSGSAMFTYAMITGVKHGWLNVDEYGPVARKAWLALIPYINADNDVTEVCVGTNKLNDRQYYYDRPRIAGDYHGQAPFLWCAFALME